MSTTEQKSNERKTFYLHICKQYTITRVLKFRFILYLDTILTPGVLTGKLWLFAWKIDYGQKAYFTPKQKKLSKRIRDVVFSDYK